MGFLCEAPQGAVHNHWARPRPRQACPSHEERRTAGRREGGGKKYSLAVLYSLLPSAHPSCFSLLKPSTLTTTPTFFLLPFPPLPLPSRWPLSSVQLQLWLVPMYSHMCRHNVTTNVKRKEEMFCKRKTEVIQYGFEEKAAVEGEEPAVNPSPSPHLPSLQFGYAAPLLLQC